MTRLEKLVLYIIFMGFFEVFTEIILMWPLRGPEIMAAHPLLVQLPLIQIMAGLFVYVTFLFVKK